MRDLKAAGITCRQGIPLADYTTFRLGGPCPLLIECGSPDEVRRVVRLLVDEQVPYVFIGGGSNLLVADAGVQDVVVRYVSPAPQIERQGQALWVSGGTLFDDLAAYSVREGLGELVTTSGIPGTVGGAIIGNAGAFGWQIADALRSVRLLDRQGHERLAEPAELQFSYRNSILKQTREIVLEADLLLPTGDPAALAAKRREILDLRAQKHPHLESDACAGSFFRNIEPTSKAERRQAAGWFLEQAGAKEMRVGEAKVFDRHANIIIKGGPECRAQDVLRLSERMAAAVHDKFGFELVREVQLLGQFDR